MTTSQSKSCDALLQEKLNILRKNEENLSQEELRVRYKISYQKLLSEIRCLYNRVMAQELFYFSYPGDFLEKGKQLVLEQFNLRKKDLAIALFCDYSADKYIKILREMNHVITEEFFSSEHIIDGINFSINPWI